MARWLDIPAWEENVGALAVPVSSMRAKIRRRAARTRRACLTKALLLRRQLARRGDASCVIASRVEDFAHARRGAAVEPTRSAEDRRQRVNSAGVDGGLECLVFPEPPKSVENLMTPARPEGAESEDGRRNGNQRNTSDPKRNRALAKRSLKRGPFLIALRVSAWFSPDC